MRCRHGCRECASPGGSTWATEPGARAARGGASPRYDRGDGQGAEAGGRSTPQASRPTQSGTGARRADLLVTPQDQAGAVTARRPGPPAPARRRSADRPARRRRRRCAAPPRGVPGHRAERARPRRDRPIAARVRCPKILEPHEVHPDRQAGLHDVQQAGLAERAGQLAGPGRRAREMARALGKRGREQHRRRVPEQAVRHEAAPVVPHRRADHAARPRHAPHLGHGKPRIRHEVQHQQRQHTIEARIREGQRTFVAHLEARAGRRCAHVHARRTSARSRRRAHGPDRSWRRASERGCPCRSPGRASAPRRRCRQDR